MRTSCILCRTKPPIKNSHVVPKFAVKRLKAGNPIGTLVHSNNPRQVHQDAWKSDLLCKECEKAFCLWEDWTCKHIFDPFLKNGNVKVKYDEKFGLFAASLCFRYIQRAFDENPQKQVSPVFQAMFDNLRESLLKKNFPGISSYLYAQFFQPVTLPGQFPPGVNTYFFESIDGECFRYIIPPLGLTWMVYVKLPGCFFILSGCDLKMIFRPPSLVDSHLIQPTGVLDSALQSGKIIALVSDTVIRQSREIQLHYSKMPAERLARNMAKIAAVQNKQQYRAHKSFELDNQLLANWHK